MPVVSVLLPTRREQTLALAALNHGVEADRIDREDGQSYVDLIGAREKIDLVIGKCPDVEILDEIDKIRHQEPLFTLVGRTGMDE